VHILFLNPQGNFDPRDRYWTEHPDFGGQLVYVKEVAAALGRMGHQVDILTRRIRDPEWEGFEESIDRYQGIPNVRIMRLPCGGDGFLRKEDLWPHLGTEWVPNIIKYYQEQGVLPEVCTTHYADGGLCGALLQQARGISFTFTGHSLGAQKMDKLGVSRDNVEAMNNHFHFTQRILAERVSMDRANRIITSTHQERHEQYGHRAYRGAISPGDDARFSIVPPGVNLEVFSPRGTALDAEIEARIRSALGRDIHPNRQDFPLVLASSRLDEKKNQMGLVQAFVESETLRESANLAIVVRGLTDPLHNYKSLSSDERGIMDQLVSMMKSAGLEGMFTGFPLNSQLELAAAYRVLARRQSLFALTALYEPFGLAPLEAMSCGLPAVVTQNGGPSESLREAGESFGVLVDPVDPGDIARGLLELLASDEVWWAYQKAGVKRVLDRYTWDRTAEGYLEVLEQIVREAEQRARATIPAYFTDPGETLEIDTLQRLYFGDD
jgi:sucrose-phosphate synthase